MNTTDKPALEAITDEAALWHARLDSGTADREAFEAWRDADPRHAVAFSRILATAEAMDGLRGADLANDPDLRAAPKISRRAVLPWAASFVAVGGVTVWGLSQARASVSSPVGGSKSFALPDGGRLDLNTDTRASWKFDDGRRRIWLERGEVALAVPTDPRPCLLFAAGQTIAVLNGEVNARLRNSAVDVTVTKGACTVKPAFGSGADRKPTEIRAGQAALSAPDVSHVRRLSDSDLQFTSGWKQGELVLEGQNLGTAVSEYNRYLSDKIVIADPDLASIRLGGRFLTHDPTDFLASLRTSFGIHVQHLGSGAVVLTR